MHFSLQAICVQAHEEWMTGFHSTLVDVNAVSKGTRTGGIRRFNAVSVVGNYQVRPAVWLT